MLEHAALLALEQLQLRVEAAAQRRRQCLAGAPLRGARQRLHVRVDAQLLSRAEHADRRPVDGPAQLAHHLLQLRVRARRVDDPRQATIQLAVARALP